MKIGLRHLPFAFAAVMVSGLAIGWLLEEAREPKPALVLGGSGNVYPSLKRTKAGLEGVEALWLDITSGEAQKQMFAAFDYGRSVRSEKRVGFIAMSSNGTLVLKEEFSRSSEEFKRDNYWLNIITARQPLAVLYRDLTNDQLKIEVAERFPPEDASADYVGIYHFVRFADLRDLTEKHSTTLYLPEAGSGTRAILDSASMQHITWPRDVEQVPDYIDQFKGTFPFVTIVSELQASLSEPDAPSCDLLSKYRIKTAAICSDSKSCDRTPLAQFSVIIKLAKDGNEGSNQFHIANAAECAVAQALTSDVSSRCHVYGKVADTDHILVIDHAKASLPPYLVCPQQKSAR